MAAALGWIMSRILIAVFLVKGLMRALKMFLRHPILFFQRKRRTSPPDCMLDPTLGEHKYVEANGLNFHYVTCGDPSKPLLLLLHGYPEFWYSWRYQLKEFSDDYHVVAVDLRGYGETDRLPNISDYFITNLCQDVLELIPALGHKKATLVAHDWGGAIAWVVTHQHPEVVEKLVVLNCPHPKAMRMTFSQLLKSWYVFAFQVPRLPEFLMSANDYEVFRDAFRGKESGVRNKNNFTVEDIEAYIFVFSQNGAATPPINYYRANVLHLEKWMRNNCSGKIDVPTLIVWGNDDAFFDVAVADGHGSVVSDVTVKHIENCSHWVQNDQPDTVNQYIREFLE